MKNTGWTEVQRDATITYHLENSPLQIRSNSEVGSDEKVRVNLFTSYGSDIAEFRLTFRSPPQYTLTKCTGETNFPTNLPSEMDKVWTISLTRNSGEIRVIVNCNDKEVLNVVLSDTTCSYSDWNTYWKKEVKKIKFDSTDTASDFYKAGEQ